jgi:acyl transferase domain-containing protein
MEMSKVTGSEIAIIGMEGLFPNCRDLQHWWEQLRNGVELISHFTQEELLATGADPQALNHPKFVAAGGRLLRDPALFDAAFFGFNPREAEVMDPQHRLFMEYCYRALEIAGYGPGTDAGRVGVFGGQSFGIYVVANLLTNPALLESLGYMQVVTVNEKDALTTQTSYKLNLTGPSVNVQTTCSTSLVAVHIACQSLLTGECDMALAGGVSIQIPQVSGYRYTDGGIASPDGHCRTFDANAKGTVFSSGVGVVVLKRLSDALADGDSIDAVILGSSINNDGSLKVGFTAPSLEGQAEVIAEAQAVANVPADTITCIEAHGTGTNLGDPIEIAALTQAFRASTDRKGFCAISSVKSNMGHTDIVAGVAGLMKAVLQLKHREFAPSINFATPNTNIDFANSPFYVNTKLQPWKSDGAPRRAGVSSFGIGGTNAHVVLQEAPAVTQQSTTRPAEILMLSAKTPAALDAASTALETFLVEHPTANLADVAHTLRVGRAHFQHRKAVICESRPAAIKSLHYSDPQHVFSSRQVIENRSVAFLFPGQGSQHIQMASGLYRNEPVFRRHLDDCAQLFEPHLGRDLRSLLYPPANQLTEAETLLTQTAYAQPALFAVEYSMAQLWLSWGLGPDAMLGHSIGEYVAACLAGVMSAASACALVAARGKLMQSMPTGAMVSVPLPEADVRALADGKLSVASLNAPRLCVVAGREEDVVVLERELAAKQVITRRLHTSHAFHSQMMDPILKSFRDEVAKVKLSPPVLRFLSNVTGTWITDEEATSPDYWTRHVRQTVRFSDGLRELLKNPETLLLEVGPGQTLTALAKQHTTNTGAPVAVPSMRHVQEERSDYEVLMAAVARLWVVGKSLDWKAFDREPKRRVPLPTYPFELQRFWIEPSTEARNVSPNTLSRYSDVADWFYAPSWKRSPLPSASRKKETWLVLINSTRISTSLIEQLRQDGIDFITVSQGDSYVRHNNNHFSAVGTQSEHYARILELLRQEGRPPAIIAHLWTTTEQEERPNTEAMQQRGFLSLLALAQALAERKEASPVRIGVITNCSHQVLGEESVVSSKATLLGPCTVIPQEDPNLSCQLIDVIADAYPSGDIVREFSTSSEDNIVAYRSGFRWVRTFASVKLPSTESAPVRRGGVWWITGGFGGIGVVLAEHLATHYGVKIVLSGRSALPRMEEWETWLQTHPEHDRISRAIQTARRIEAAGSEVLLLQADVNDEGSMVQALAQIVSRFGAVHGVIHSAGVAGAGLIQLKTLESVDKVMRAKVQGTEILARVISNQPLEKFVLCSSITAVLGGPGQVDYCGANAYLDSFAVERSANLPVVTIGWDAWREIGMAVDTKVPADMQHARAQQLREALSSREGAEAFERILASGLSHVVVSTHDLNAILIATRPKPAREETKFAEMPQSIGPRHSRPEIRSDFAQARSDLDAVLVGMWEDVLGISGIGILDNFFDLGGHSLLATQVLTRINDLFQVNLPLRIMFDRSTVSELSDHLISIESQPGRMAKIASVLRRVENMSNEEIASALQQRTAGI